MPDFPRGGANELTPLEMRDITDKVKQDILFHSAEEPVTNKPAKKRKKQVTSEPSKKTKTESIHHLSFQRLSVGMNILGVVKDVNELEVVVSLPNQLTGSVSIASISSTITELVEKAANDEEEEDLELPKLENMFKTGQPLICTITKLSDASKEANSKRRIELSLMPSQVNKEINVESLHRGMFLSAEVISIEDHGFIMDLGFAKGFLAKKHIESPESVELGQVLSCFYMKMDAGGRTAFVTCLSKTLSEEPLEGSDTLTLESLTAGTLVNTRIKEIRENGLILTVASFYEGSVDLFHVGFPVSDPEKSLQRFKEGAKLRARVLYVDPMKKKLGLTLRMSLLSWDSFDFGSIHIGTVFEETKVIRVDQGAGITASLPGTSTPGFVHISHISDNHIEKIDKGFKVGSVHTGRVIGLDYCDGVILLSYESKILNQPFLRLEDIPVASELKGTVIKVDTYGVLVAVSDHIKGLCPKTHLSDIFLSQPEKLFKEGSVQKFKVLSVDPKERRLILTHKKSLLNSKYEPIVSYESTKIGQIGSGVISAVKPFGCLVTFYNQVKAIAPINELSDTFVQDPSEIFKVGQAVKCRVLAVDPQNEKMRVSFKLTGKTTGASVAQADIAPGAILKGTVLVKEENGLLLESQGSHLYLPKAHLSDFTSQADAAYQEIKENSVLEDLMAIALDAKNARVVVTLKKQFKQAYLSGQHITWESLKDNLILPGFVRNITDTTCFIEFPGGIVGVANKHSLSDSFVANISDHVQVGQSVIALITQIDHDAKRLSVTLKSSQVEASPSYREYELSLLEQFLKVKDSNRSQSKSISHKIGQVVHGTVDKLVPFGATIKLQDGISGLITRVQKLKEGDSISALVIDINYDSGVLDLAPVTAKAKKSTKKLEKLITSKDRVDAFVEMVKTDYTIVSLPSVGNAIAYVLSRTINTKANRMSRFRAGQTTKVILGNMMEQDSISRLLATSARAETNQVLDAKRSIINAYTASLTSLEEIKLGMTVKAQVRSIKPTQMNLQIADNLKGRIHTTSAFDSVEQVKNLKAPFAQYKSGDMIDCKVIGFHDAKTHRFLPFSHRNPLSTTVVELSIRPSDMTRPEFQLADQTNLNFDQVTEGDQVMGVVQAVEPDALWVQISPSLMGRVNSLLVSKDLEVVQNLQGCYYTGQVLSCSVIGKKVEKKALDFSLLPSSDRIVGHTVACRISKIDESKGLSVFLGDSYGRIPLPELSNELDANPLQPFTAGQYLSAQIISNHDGQTVLSLRDSPLNIESIEEGQILNGYIRQITDKGCFVNLSATVVARVKIAELSDKFIKDFKTAFKAGSLVKGKIIGLNKELKQVEMSLKSSLVDPSGAEDGFAKLIKGQTVTGSVKKVEKFGLFIQISGTSIAGLCHISQVSDEPVSDLNALYSQGDHVKALILKLDPKKKKVSLGIKPSYFTPEDAEGEDISVMEQDAQNSDDEVIEQMEIDDDINEDSEASSDEEMEDVTPVTVPIAQPLSLEGFSWDAANPLDEHQDHPSDSDSENSDEEVNRKKKSRRAKKRAKKEEEERIQKEEEALVAGDHAPEMAQDYEKLLLGSPNNSYLWIKYMAFELQMAEVGKARKVAEKALKCINFREEQERLNVWIAFLNLENSYGTPESFTSVFEKAQQNCDPKKLHIQVAQIYERTEKFDNAEKLHQIMCKKFKGSSKIWINFGLFLMNQSKLEQARSLLQRALQSLEKRKHLKVISKFAQMEFKLGEAERGRTIFEGVMTQYPRRIDLWSIYLDMEIKSANIDSTRRLFERVLKLKWSTKKMKFLFKKYLDFEKKHGSPEGVEHVKDAAMRYVESLN